MAKILPYQNFPGIQSIIFSKRIIRTTSIPKITRIHSGVWKLKAKNLQNCQFWPKNEQILATNGQILAISEFSWHIHYDFLKEDHKGSFHTKYYESLQRRLEDISQKHSRMAILAKNGQILIIFGHFGVKKFFDRKNFWWSSKSYVDTTSCKKYILSGQGCRTGTDSRAHAQTRVNLQVPSGV